MSKLLRYLTPLGYALLLVAACAAFTALLWAMS